jgi:hypothetical protein
MLLQNWVDMKKSHQQVKQRGKPSTPTQTITTAQFGIPGADINQRLGELRFAIVDTDEQIADPSEEIAPVVSQ